MKELAEICIPEELCCPLSTQIFLNPVSLPCGTIVEEEMIVIWIKEKGTSPFTREPITELDLKPDVLIRKKIIDFFEEHKNNPLILGIKENQYVNRTNTSLSLTSVQEPTDPDEDDLLAMGVNASRQNNSNPPTLSGLGFDFSIRNNLFYHANQINLPYVQLRQAQLRTISSSLEEGLSEPRISEPRIV